MSIVRTWGSTSAERAEPFPCDPLIPTPDDELYRAVTIAAPPAIVFRWLCQLRVAPYSYDLLDNLGRTSPRTLTPGLDALAAGQRVMTIFRLVEFEPDHHLTVVLDRARAVFGDLAVTYRVTPDPAGSRLVVKMSVRRPRGVMRVVGSLLPAGDLVMMRKQLLTLKRLAEDQARRNVTTSTSRNAAS
ncbi:MAG: SRPBCC family protein [Kofleriaceae bacterium]